MCVLIDECVPRWIGDVFNERHHETIQVEDVPLRADEAIALFGNDLSAIVVTRNWKHFKEFTAKKLPAGTRKKFRRLGVIEIRCGPSDEERRLREDIELIECEYNRRLTTKDRRISIEIKTTSLIIRR